MKDRIRRFMAGRYGTDALNQFLNIVSLVFMIVGLVLRWTPCVLLGFAALAMCYYRTFSRNISKRTEENYRFYTTKDRFAAWTRQQRQMWANRQNYRYYRCPQCRQKLRVPRGRGRIQISCPRCGTQFIKKS